MASQNTRPQKKTKKRGKYIMWKEDRRKTSPERRDQEVAKKKSDQDQTSQLQ